MRIWPFNRFPAKDPEVNLLQENLARYLRQIEICPLLNGNHISNIGIATGTSTIPHGLGRKPIGLIQLGCNGGNNVKWLKTSACDESIMTVYCDVNDYFSLWVF